MWSSDADAAKQATEAQVRRAVRSPAERSLLDLHSDNAAQASESQHGHSVQHDLRDPQPDAGAPTFWGAAAAVPTLSHPIGSTQVINTKSNRNTVMRFNFKNTRVESVNSEWRCVELAESRDIDHVRQCETRYKVCVCARAISRGCGDAAPTDVRQLTTVKSASISVSDPRTGIDTVLADNAPVLRSACAPPRVDGLTRWWRRAGAHAADGGGAPRHRRRHLVQDGVHL